MDVQAEVSRLDGQGTRFYRNYVLLALLAIYIFDVIDRILFALVQEDIKADLLISDFQLGLLGGLLYSFSGLPIAYWADRGNRVTIVTLGIAFWSFATAACGYAQNFVQLLGLRTLVGVGEAACLPPSHSLISDYFPVKQRGSALAVYGLAIPIGAMIASVAGGWITAHFGWRQAFFVLGVPGLVLALFVKLTVREPVRVAQAQAGNPLVSLKRLLAKPTFRHVAFAGALMGLYLYSINQFLVSFIVRRYAVPLDVAAMIYGLVVTLAIGAGIFLGGFVSDRLNLREPRAVLWLPVFGCVVGTPMFLLGFSQASLWPMVVFVSLAMMLVYLYMSPMFTVTQLVAGPELRASASALSLLISTLIGYGMGPPLVGWIADRVRAGVLDQAHVSSALCDANPQMAACAAAGAHGLQIALMVTTAALLWAAVHFLIAGRSLSKDRVD